jgi:hypothetical protein
MKLKNMMGLQGVSILGKEAQKLVKGGAVVEYGCICAGPFGESVSWTFSSHPVYGYGPDGPTPEERKASIDLWCGVGTPATCLWQVQGNPNTPV